MKARSYPSPCEWQSAIARGDRLLLSKAITLIESTHSHDIPIAQSLLQECQRKCQESYRAGRPHALRIAITGAPGVGKSTLIERWGSFLIEKKARRVAVLAIDPSSPKNKGSILGDKTRMQSLARNPGAYIRPSPSLGHKDGINFRSRETMLLCESAGYDTILIETVGVGQSQIAVQEISDLFILLVLPDGGDSLQGIKRGIMEVVDLLLVHKADATSSSEAKKRVAEYSSTLALQAPKSSQWKAQSLACSAHTGLGLEALWEAASRYMKEIQSNGYFEKNRLEQNKAWLKAKILEDITSLGYRINQDLENHANFVKWQKDLEKGSRSVGDLSRKILESYKIPLKLSI